MPYTSFNSPFRLTMRFLAFFSGSLQNILIRVTPCPLWDSKDFGSPVQLPYGLRVGQNVLVSDAHFQFEYLNDPKYRRPGHPIRPSNNFRCLEEGSSGTSFCSSSSKVSPMLDQGGEYMGDQSSNSSTVDWDLRNGDSNPLVDIKGTRESLFRSLPTVVPIWQQTTWVANSRPRYTAIVADLGLCLDLSQENADTVSLVGNPYYISPECLNRVAPYSFAADLFAIGLLICELVTQLVNDGVNVPRTKEFGLDHEHLPVPTSCPNWFFQLAVDCCTVDHQKRPTTAEVIERLTEFLSADPASITPTDLPDVISSTCAVGRTTHAVSSTCLLNGSSELNGVGKGKVPSVDA
ncbi:unnamed protein product [Echinostoma caproni]|uniref:Protein kinase domain-containing protein n=1 Tax=Echinostoma caproni TaxID=27848 RepID=A0A183AKJ0_9TREM|nr:unnamed protein product [Echinostoma caproni]